PPRIPSKSRVLIDGGHRERMQRLQQQCAESADEHRRIAMHPTDRIGGSEAAGPWAPVNALASGRALVAGDSSEDRGPEPGPDGLQGIHVLSIGGDGPLSR